MTEPTPADIHAQIREPWLQFIRLTSEHRPALFAFGLKLTGSPFDGEDLVHEAIVRAFGASAAHDGALGDQGWVTVGLAHHREDLKASGEVFPSRIERVEIAGVQVLAVDRQGDDGMLLEEVWLLETVDGRIADIHDYCFSPQVVEHVGQLLGVRPRLLGYHYAG